MTEICVFVYESKAGEENPFFECWRTLTATTTTGSSSSIKVKIDQLKILGVGKAGTNVNKLIIKSLSPILYAQPFGALP